MQKAFSIALLGLSAAAAFAQVTVEVAFDQEQFLRSESLPVRVRISNFSGQPLRLGDEPGWLSFKMEGQDGKAVGRLDDLPAAKPFTIESAKTVVLRTDLMPCFNLSEPGRYTMSAKIKVPQLGKDLASELKPFDIVSGVELWQMKVGVPNTTPPVVRKYMLQQATFLKQPQLYVRLTDENESRVIRVVPVGPLLSFSKPEAQVDKSSNLHVIHQYGKSSFLYVVVTPAGDLIIRQTHDITTSRPQLRTEEDGRVVVVGGARKISLSDLPPAHVANTDEKLVPR